MNIIITIPAYNEEKTIGPLITRIKAVIKKNKYKAKVLVLDDGSKDKTKEIATKLGAVVKSHPRNYGLAETFRSEIKEALKLKADVIVHIDADMQYRPEEIPKLINEIKKGYDLVLGSRFLGKIEEMPLINWFGNKAFSSAISHITKVKISDAQTGFRAFTKQFAKEIQIGSDHTYTQEQIIRAINKKFTIKEVPIYFAKRHGKSRLIRSPFMYAIKAWINIIRIYRDNEPLKVFGAIGGSILSVGIVISLYMVYLHFTSGIVGHLGLLMLNITVLSLGFQILIFALLADMFRKK